jgi:hypothetical protein
MMRWSQAPPNCDVPLNITPMLLGYSPYRLRLALLLSLVGSKLAKGMHGSYDRRMISPIPNATAGHQSLPGGMFPKSFKSTQRVTICEVRGNSTPLLLG